MLLEKYRPKSLKEVIGNAKQVAEIKDWLKSWKRGDALIVFGPPGCGKSLCVELIAKEGGYELVQSHATDDRGYKELQVLLESSGQQSLLARKKIMFIDELEMLDSAKGVTEIIGGSSCPVILATSNPYEQKLAYLRKQCRLCKFDKIRADSIAAFLRSVCSKESISCGDAAISQLSKMCNGDVRSAMLDLECAAVNNANCMHRDKEENIFETLKILFKTLDLSNSRYAIGSSEKPAGELMLWLEENIPNEYEDAGDIASAYDCLSKADVVSSRIIRRQSWSLQKYVSSHLCGVSFAKNASYKKFTAYSFPRTRTAKKFDGVAEKLSTRLHASRKDSLQYACLILLLAKRTGVAKSLGLNEDDVAALKEIK